LYLVHGIILGLVFRICRRRLFIRNLPRADHSLAVWLTCKVVVGLWLNLTIHNSIHQQTLRFSSCLMTTISAMSLDFIF
jgi:hypothetical protein